MDPLSLEEKFQKKTWTPRIMSHLRKAVTLKGRDRMKQAEGRRNAVHLGGVEAVRTGTLPEQRHLRNLKFVRHS